MTADELLREFEDAEPDTVRLAEAVSLAVHVEPALLRAARLSLRPVPPTSAEADLWFSPLVDAASPRGLVLRPDVADLLRSRLAEDGERLERARALVASPSRAISPALRLEEDLIWHALADHDDADERIAELWQRALATMLRDEKRTAGLARWALRAVDGVPQRARTSRPAQMLLTAAGVVAGRRIDVDAPETAAWLPWLLPESVPTVPIGVRLVSGGVEASAPPVTGAHVIDVPATTPRILHVGLPGADTGGALVTLAENGRATVDLTELVLWSMPGHTELVRFAVAGRPVAVALPRKGGVPAVALDSGMAIVFSDRDDRPPLTIPSAGAVASLMYTVDGQGLVAVHGDGRVRRYRLPHGPWETIGDVAFVDPEAVSCDGAHAIGRAADGWAIVSIQEGDRVDRFEPTPGTTLVATGGDIAVGASADGQLTVTDLRTGELRVTIDGPVVESVTVDTSGSMIAALDDSGDLTAWDPRTRSPIANAHIGTGTLFAGERAIAVLADDAVVVCSATEVGRLEREGLYAAAVTDGGRLLVTGGESRRLELRTARGVAFTLERAGKSPARQERGRVELRATYRLQLGPGLTFEDARALVPYLRDIGVSHLHLSPAFAAREGSTHGYDVIDPRRLSEALGGEEGFRALAAAAHEAGLGIVLEIVPNHMATDDANPFWSDEKLRARFFDFDPVTGRHRRFFDIDHLAGVRQEDPEVFAATHELALALVHEGLVDGLHIEHPDGLADPGQYLERLRDAGVAHVWVDKILDPGERLRDWPVEGTVGYEFLADVAALFVDPAGEAALDALWEEVSGDPRPFGAVAGEAKREQVATTFAPEVEWLRRVWDKGGIEDALAALPVYRTYIVDEPDAQDLAVLREAGLEGWLDGAPREFVTRFQQLTPPVMAMAVEDTAFYRYLRLLALNDVGGDPSRFGLSVDAFHRANLERAERFPRNLLTTQTQATKRSGDVRARIGALSGMPEAWAGHVRAWYAACEPLRRDGAPDRTEMYLIFQTLTGAWPLEPERLEAYVVKALREAKRSTAWMEPDVDWEERVTAFCRALYEHEPFLSDFEPFASELALAGRRAALGQLVLKLTAPGVPDVYQGDELLNLSLADPDNRRPIDWAHRRALLDELRDGAPERPETWKLAVIERLLALRARRPAAFAGAYEPVDAGPGVCAYVRGGEVLALVPVRDYDGARLAVPGRWRSVFDGREADLGHGVAVTELLGDLPVALLERAGDGA
jgi:(1->4)-alpha-D-glucan 1-alpha-D-glucosylmutase